MSEVILNVSYPKEIFVTCEIEKKWKWRVQSGSRRILQRIEVNRRTQITSKSLTSHVNLPPSTLRIWNLMHTKIQRIYSASQICVIKKSYFIFISLLAPVSSLKLFFEAYATHAHQMNVILLISAIRLESGVSAALFCQHSHEILLWLLVIRYLFAHSRSFSLAHLFSV